jgi:hypothetical protein
MLLKQSGWSWKSVGRRWQPAAIDASLTASANPARMKSLIVPVVVGLLVGVSAAVAQEGSATREVGVTRPGGTYATLPGADPNACAQACARDGLCMSWTVIADVQPRCELKAVIPHPIEDSLAISGLSPRAPAFARLVAPREIGPPRTLTNVPDTPAPDADTAEIQAPTPTVASAVTAPTPVEMQLAGMPAPPVVALSPEVRPHPVQLPEAAAVTDEPVPASVAENGVSDQPVDPILLNAAPSALPIRDREALPAPALRGGGL